jgi:hypothetical protein
MNLHKLHHASLLAIPTLMEMPSQDWGIRAVGLQHICNWMTVIRKP